jgi:hypothetical protein
MAGYDEVMDGLCAKVQQVIGQNAVALAQHGVGPQRRPPIPPEKQWWNFAAKAAVARQIVEEESNRFKGQSNNLGDAMRHANASRRLTERVGPIYAQGAGIYHEADNLAHAAWDNVKKAIAPNSIPPGTSVPSPGQAISESLMDLRNNAEGRREALEGRGLDVRRLQTRPVGPVPSSASYQDRSAKRP